jgi:hypothetical protein
MSFFFIESKKRKPAIPSKKRFEKGRDMTVIFTSILITKVLNRNRHGDVSHCGKSHDGYMLYFI